MHIKLARGYPPGIRADSSGLTREDFSGPESERAVERAGEEESANEMIGSPLGRGWGPKGRSGRRIQVGWRRNAPEKKDRPHDPMVDGSNSIRAPPVSERLRELVAGDAKTYGGLRQDATQQFFRSPGNPSALGGPTGLPPSGAAGRGKRVRRARAVSAGVDKTPGHSANGEARRSRWCGSPTRRAATAAACDAHHAFRFALAGKETPQAFQRPDRRLVDR